MKNKQDKLYAINMYFSKKVGLIRVWGKGPEAGKFSRIVVLKVTLQSVRLLLTVLQKKWGQDVLVAPPIILLVEQLLPLAPAHRVPAPMALAKHNEACGRRPVWPCPLGKLN